MGRHTGSCPDGRAGRLQRAGLVDGRRQDQAAGLRLQEGKRCAGDGGG